MYELADFMRAARVRSERGLEELCDELAAEGRIQRYVRDRRLGERAIKLYYSNASGEPAIPWDERDVIYCAALAVMRVIDVMWVEFDNGKHPVVQIHEEYERMV